MNLYVLQKTESQAGLERHEGEYMMTEYLFLGGNYPFE